MNDEHSPQSYVTTNYLPLETDVEKIIDPSHSKPSTWRYNPNQYFGCDITLTIVAQHQIFQVWAFCYALLCDGPRSFGLLGVS
jgi:hypothetical protein